MTLASTRLSKGFGDGQPVAASRYHTRSRFLPAGVAPERGLQVRTILTARSISAEFPHRLAKFTASAEQIAAAVDQCIAELHGSSLGRGADAEREYHQRWVAADKQMREALTELRTNVERAHRNYDGVAQHNTAMWP